MSTVSSLPTHTSEDEVYDGQFSQRIKKLSPVHWSPFRVIKVAAAFLSSKPGSQIIDIGSGIGKFCVIAAKHHPDCNFYGIEQRKNLHEIALISKQNSSGAFNMHFMHGNFTELDFSSYDGLYFFNSFAENLYTFGRIDNSIQYSASLYNYYANYFYKILENKASGTRLVTYHGNENEIPSSYKLKESHFKNQLKMYIKE